MKKTSLAVSLAGALVTAGLLAPPVQAQVLTKTLVASGIGGASYVTSPVGDFDRLFVTRLGGQIRIIKNGTLLPTPFLDLTSIVNRGGEQGLLGLAFHPNYAANGFFYVNYTNAGGDTIVARYSVTANPDIADPTSAVTIIGPINQPQSNHNGGCIAFGGDGMLYIGMGDGGGANDSGAGHAAGGNAQSGSTLLGKILRLDVDLPFPHIPPSNPFVGNGSVRDEVWAMGIRNPWRFSFDMANGDLYIGDVGQDAREEIDFQAGTSLGGLNYGWRCMEGFNCTGLSGCTCNGAGIELPIHAYSHTPGCVSVTGGNVYRGCAIPALDGTYIFGDYCKDQVWSFEYDGVSVSNFQDRTAEIIGTGGPVTSVTSFGQDARGEVYLCDSGGGRVYRITEAGVPQSDCNLNGVPDACDISLGNSPDANGNGIPDECECAPAPTTYCTGKINSLLCLPGMSFQGVPKVGNPFPFHVEASQVLNNMNGLLYYGYAPDNAPFQGGTRCVAPPVLRTALQNSGGNAGFGTDCSGTFSFDFNAYIASGFDPMLVAGQQVNAQYWSRDPNSPSFPSNLTNALEFVICN